MSQKREKRKKDKKSCSKICIFEKIFISLHRKRKTITLEDTRGEREQSRCRQIGLAVNKVSLYVASVVQIHLFQQMYAIIS